MCHGTYTVHVPASGVPYVPCTVWCCHHRSRWRPRRCLPLPLPLPLPLTPNHRSRWRRRRCSTSARRLTLTLTPNTLTLTPSPYPDPDPDPNQEAGHTLCLVPSSTVVIPPGAMVEVPPLAVPEVGSRASSGHAWQLWLARRSQGSFRATGPPASASGAQASRLQSRRFPRL